MTHELTRRQFALGAAGAAGTIAGISIGGWPVLANPALATSLSDAAGKFVAGLSAKSRAAALLPFKDRQRIDWHYIPRDRPGVTLDQLSAAERRGLWNFLGQVFSRRGLDQIEGVIKLERTLGELTNNLSFRDPGDYAIVFFGDPRQPGPVAWRFEGHHLSISLLVVPGLGIGVTPSFFGANPANVPHRHKHRGFRLLGAEEDAAFGLLRSLDDSLRRKVLIASGSLGDIVAGPGREDALKSFAGVPLSALGEGQRSGIYRILELYAGTMRPEIAKAAVDRVRADGADKLHFAWAGSLEPGRPHYFRIHGPSALIEYDNTQDGANHVHSVWIDPLTVFGRDVLRRHHKHDH